MRTARHDPHLYPPAPGGAGPGFAQRSDSGPRTAHRRQPFIRGSLSAAWLNRRIMDVGAAALHDTSQFVGRGLMKPF